MKIKMTDIENMELMAEGNSNWNYYFDKGMVFAIAKEDSGASDSTFGNIDYFSKFLEYCKGNSENVRLTDFGKEIMKTYNKCNRGIKCFYCPEGRYNCFT